MKTIQEINQAISQLDNQRLIFDGFHTFEEHYHRMVLFAVICRTYRDKAWKGRQHEDRSMYDGFIVGLSTPEGILPIIINWTIGICLRWRNFLLFLGWAYAEGCHAFAVPIE